MRSKRVPRKRSTYKNSSFYGAQTKKVRIDPRLLSSGLIISVKEARKILASDAENLSDEAVMQLIFDHTDLAQELINASTMLQHKS